MKIFITLFVMICGFAYSQQTQCNYTSPTSSGTGSSSIIEKLALDLIIPANTQMKLDYAKFEITLRYSHQMQNFATVFLYEDSLGIPGTLISSRDVTIEAISIYGTNTTTKWDVTIPLNSLEPISAVNNTKKIWLAFKLHGTLDHPYPAVYMSPKTAPIVDETPAKYFDPSTNSWKNITEYSSSTNTLIDRDLAINVYINCQNLSIEENQPEKSILFPNPVKNILTLTNEKIKVLEIYDLDGKKVNFKSISNNKLDLSSLFRGIYIIKLKDYSGKIYTEKIIKE